MKICRYASQFRNNLSQYDSQAFLKPNPERADELRQITPGSEGFLKRVWPKLDMVTVALSGPYAMALPKVFRVLKRQLLRSYYALHFLSYDTSLGPL